jgi:anti-sigma B factor antagonist
MNAFDFDQQVHTEPGLTRIVLRGELDLGTAPRVDREIAQARQRGDAIDLDLRELTFMDSTGVRLLLVATQTRTGSDPPLRMFAPRHGDALIALEETGILGLLPLVDAPDQDGAA